MNASSPQNNENRSQSGPASVPLNPPASASGIPMNVPRNMSPPAAPGQPRMGMQGNEAPPPPAAYGTSPGMQHPYPPQMPGSYQVPQTPYAPQQNSGYRPMSSSTVSDGPAIGMGLLAGILLALVCGVGFGFASIAIGFRIPYLSLGIGYLIGYAVLYASQENGDMQGLIGGACSLAACLLGMGIMYLNGIFISPFSFIIVAFAVYRGYAIPAGG